jgi:hypothetical protein
MRWPLSHEHDHHATFTATAPQPQPRPRPRQQLRRTSQPRHAHGQRDEAPRQLVSQLHVLHLVVAHAVVVRDDAKELRQRRGLPHGVRRPLDEGEPDEVRR